MRSSYPPFWRSCLLLALGLTALAGAGCRTTPTPPKYFVQFYTEARGDSGIAFTLPESKLEYRREIEPFATAAKVTDIQLGTVNVTGMKRYCVFFQFDAMATRDLYQATGANIGRRIFLFANDKPMGVRYVDDTIQNGQLFVFVEISDPEKLQQFVTDLQASQKQLADIKASR
ncbi:MAG TPA: hypothetical protein VHC95_12955 [Opitutales bacterium]|nr:hypothetical protein [Opitutales bacterium]